MASSSTQKRKYDAFTEIGRESRRRKLSASPKLYDAFISHRGPDVKETLAKQIYHSLLSAGCHAFIDSEEIKLGQSIPTALRNAIESSSVQIAIFSPRYAESPWCLDELVLMLDSEATVIPVFYNVAPWELRHIEKGVYASAFNKYEEKRRYLHKLGEWKQVLYSAASISGYEYKNDDNDLCSKIVSAVLKEVQRTKKSLVVAKHEVGLAELVEGFEICCRQKVEGMVQIVGICGMGGSGKTTLAKQVFNIKQSQYDASCFLFDVRETFGKGEGTSLQTKLLVDLVDEENCPKFGSIQEGTGYLRERMRQAESLRFLIVLDDIDHMKQLNALLVPEKLNPDSLVIVTTRNERVLIRARISTVYKMKEMDRHNSIKLFCWHAFEKAYPAAGYNDLVESFVEQCRGLPLCLEVLGGHVSGSNDQHYWELELKKVRRTLPGDVMQILKISFDSLDEEEQQIFMDLACFYPGEEDNVKSTALRVWEGSGWNAEHALQTLLDKSLVFEVELETDFLHIELKLLHKIELRMHDHLRDLGRELAKKLSPPRRLWRPQDLKSLELKGIQNILVTQISTHSFRCFHRASVVDPSLPPGSEIEYFIGNSDDCVETSALLWLKLLLPKTSGYMHLCIPPWLPLQDLRVLTIDRGHFKRLWQDSTQAPLQLRDLMLCNTESFDMLAGSLEMLSCLERLDLSGPYVRGEFLDGLSIQGTSFSKWLSKLINLRRLSLCRFEFIGEWALNSSGGSTTSCMCFATCMNIGCLKHLGKVSISGDHCPNLNMLSLYWIYDLIELDLEMVTTLKYIEVDDCSKLQTLSGISDLKQLEWVTILRCSEIKVLSNLAHLSCVERVVIDGCEKLHSIEGIDELKQLKHLFISTRNGALWNQIYRLQRLPSELTVIVGRAVSGAESTLNASLFSDAISSDRVHPIEVNKNGYAHASLIAPNSLSAIVVCAVCNVDHNSIQKGRVRPIMINIPRGEDIITYTPDGGEWITTVVITDPRKIKGVRDDFSQYRPLWIPYADDEGKRYGCVVTVKKEEESKALHIFKTIISHLYERS